MADYENYYASFVRFVKDFNSKVDLKDATRAKPEFVDFDLHLDASTLPHGDIVGIRGMAVTIDQVTADITILFGVSTLSDTGHFRHRAIIDQLLHKLLPSKKIEFVDAENGVVRGYLVVKAGTAVLPMSKTKVRAFQQISVNFLTDRKPGP